MFAPPVISPALLAERFVQLLPEYLPGVDTGAFAVTDRRRCWNKTLKAVLAVIAKEKNAAVEIGSAVQTPIGDQLALSWKRDGAVVFTVATGWGDRSEVERALEWLEALKSPQKLFVYACSKWQEAVREQIHAALLRYPYHLEGEQYLFMNLLGLESKMHLLVADMPRHGPLVSYQPHLLQPLPGSPFLWSTRSGVAR